MQTVELNSKIYISTKLNSNTAAAAAAVPPTFAVFVVRNIKLMHQRSSF